MSLLLLSKIVCPCSMLTILLIVLKQYLNERLHKCASCDVNINIKQSSEKLHGMHSKISHHDQLSLGHDLFNCVSESGILHHRCSLNSLGLCRHNYFGTVLCCFNFNFFGGCCCYDYQLQIESFGCKLFHDLEAQLEQPIMHFSIALWHGNPCAPLYNVFLYKYNGNIIRKTELNYFPKII